MGVFPFRCYYALLTDPSNSKLHLDLASFHVFNYGMFGAHNGKYAVSYAPFSFQCDVKEKMISKHLKAHNTDGISVKWCNNSTKIYFRL